MRTIVQRLLLATCALWVAVIPAATADTTVSARLQPLNDSGAHGTVTLTVSGDGALTVVLKAQGLVPGQPHAQHIHGSIGGGHFMCPSAADDTDGDGVLTNEEATGEYGTIYMSLTTSGAATAASGLALDRMPVADDSGEISYRRTFPAAMVPADLTQHLSEVHVVLHGIDANDNDRYDVAGLGISTFAENLGMKGVPEEATDPAACGVVTGAGTAMQPMGGIETGGGDAVSGRSWQAPLGAGVLVLAAALLGLSMARRVPRRGGTGPGDEARDVRP